jgi:hypothetical protein
MSSRFSFPHAYDPQMHRDEMVTLSRTTSPQNGTHKVNGKPTLLPAMTTTAAPQAPKRRHFVFADPVAFRYIYYV